MSNTENTIGRIIKDRRAKLGLTLEDVGNFVGVGKSTVKKWEDGYISNMKRDKISLLADILQVSPITFISGVITLCDNVESKSSVNTDLNLTPHEKDLITAYRKQPEMQSAVDRLLGISEHNNTYTIKKVARNGTQETLTVTDDDIKKFYDLETPPEDI